MLTFDIHYLLYFWRHILWIKQSWAIHWIPLCLKYMFTFLFFLSFCIYIYFIITIIIIIYVYVFSTCTGLAEKPIRFSQGLSLVLYFYFLTFYFCIVQLWVLVNLKYRKKKKNQRHISTLLPYLVKISEYNHFNIDFVLKPKLRNVIQNNYSRKFWKISKNKTTHTRIL